MSGFVWALNQQMKQHASNEFKTIDKQGIGKINGSQAKEIFGQVGLSIEDLAHIWKLSDIDRDGNLNEVEYMIAKFLIFARQSDQPLPPTLPDSLLASISQAPQANIQAAPRTEVNDPWFIQPADYKKYQETFMKHKNPQGKLTGQAAFGLFSISGLKNETLAKVWELADLNKDHHLDESEFAIAMHLIHFAIASGGELKLDRVPPALLNSAKVAGGTAIVPVPAAPIQVPEIILPDISITIKTPTLPQIDASPIIPPDVSVLAQKYQITDILIAPYDPTVEKQRAEREIQNSKTAQQVLEQSEPEIKQLSIKFENEGLISSGLGDKSKYMQDQLNVVENQRQQLLIFMKDLHNQSLIAEKELKTIYEELVTMKNIIQRSALSSGEVPDPNFIRLQRQQISQEQAEVAHQIEAVRVERARLVQELELLQRDIQTINMGTLAFEKSFGSQEPNMQARIASQPGQQQNKVTVGGQAPQPIISQGITFNPILDSSSESGSESDPLNRKGKRDKKSKGKSIKK